VKCGEGCSPTPLVPCCARRRCADNAAAEGFFGMLKSERVYRRRYLTLDDARSDVFDYIERSTIHECNAESTPETWRLKP
jgi:transposase InsO family protein